MNYQEKYIKYKLKYLQLKEQIGGDDKNEIRFQNCAILKLSIRYKNTIIETKLDLIYSGEVEDDRIFYVSGDIIDKIESEQNIKNYILCTHNTRIRCFIDKYFEIINGQTEKHLSNRIIFSTRKAKKPIDLLGENYDKLQDKNIDIYIIRHGEGTHNIKKGLKKKLTQVFGNNDTELTKNGINQAINAGNALKKYLINNKITKFDYLFGSKLKRTRQTLINILGQIDIENFNIPKHIIILPCSHELSKFKESINCDELNESTFIPSENRANCVCGATDTMSINCNTTKIQTNPECINEKGYNIDWTKFNEFTQKRALYSKKDLEYSGCRNTNFIKQIIDIISK